MSSGGWQEFVLAGTRTGKVAVVRRDGRPHVSPVWFTLDDVGERADGAHPDVVFMTGAGTVKARALRRTGRFALAVDDQEPPYSFISLTCRVSSMVDDPAQALPWATRLGARYLGPARAAEFGARNAVPGELLVRAEVTSVVALAALAD